MSPLIWLSFLELSLSSCEIFFSKAAFSAMCFSVRECTRLASSSHCLLRAASAERSCAGVAVLKSTSGVILLRCCCPSREVPVGVVDASESVGTVDWDSGELARLLIEPPVFARGRVRDLGILEELDVRDIGGAVAGV